MILPPQSDRDLVTLTCPSCHSDAQAQDRRIRPPFPGSLSTTSSKAMGAAVSVLVVTVSISAGALAALAPRASDAPDAYFRGPRRRCPDHNGVVATNYQIYKESQAFICDYETDDSATSCSYSLVRRCGLSRLVVVLTVAWGFKEDGQPTPGVNDAQCGDSAPELTGGCEYVCPSSLGPAAEPLTVLYASAGPGSEDEPYGTTLQCYYGSDTCIFVRYHALARYRLYPCAEPRPFCSTVGTSMILATLACRRTAPRLR